MTATDRETIVAELTPKGRGAVAVVVVAGPDATRAVDKCFAARSGRPLDATPLGRIAFGHWGGAGGEELIVCRRSAEEVEVHCHGGIAAIEAVIDQLVTEGCQRITWQQWIDRSSEWPARITDFSPRASYGLTSVLRGPDAVRAAAQIALASATTERAAGILLDQLNGALSAKIRELVVQIAAADRVSARAALDALLDRRRLGLHLTEPWRIVVFGAPNVGKSSLLNALAGYQRAIVSAIPGTTRDVITVSTAIDGWPVQLSDTAGIRETNDELERAGIGLATSTLSRADLAILVHDAEQLHHNKSNNGSRVDRSMLAPNARIIDVLNKIDLVADVERPQLRRELVPLDSDPEQSLALSALTGEGLPDLISAIGRSFVRTPITPGSAVPFTAKQFAALDTAKAAMEEHDIKGATAALQSMLTDL